MFWRPELMITVDSTPRKVHHALIRIPVFHFQWNQSSSSFSYFFFLSFFSFPPLTILSPGKSNESLVAVSGRDWLDRCRFRRDGDAGTTRPVAELLLNKFWLWFFNNNNNNSGHFYRAIAHRVTRDEFTVTISTKMPVYPTLSAGWHNRAQE